MHTRAAPSTVPAPLPHILLPDTRRVNNLTINADLNYGNPGTFDPAKPSPLDTTGLTLVFFNHGSTPITVSDRHVFIELANGDFNTADKTDTLHGNPYRVLRVLPKTQRLLHISPFSGRLPVKRIVYMDGWNICEWKTDLPALQPAATKPKAISRKTLLDFYQAIVKDDVVGVRRGLLRGMRVSELLPEFRQTPLMLAAESDSFRAFNFLLVKGADTHVRDADGKNALYYAVTVGRSGTQNGSPHKRETRHIAMLRALLSRGLSVNDNARNGDTPLMLLARYNMISPERLRFLIHNGADINSLNDQNQSALHIAVDHDLVNMARLLIANGADPNVRDVWGGTPLMLAANVTNPDFALMELLLDKGAAINARDDGGRTPLIHLLWDASSHYIHSYHDNENEEKGPFFTPPGDDCLRLLLRRGADLTAQDKQGNTALSWAKATLVACETDEHRKQAQHVIDILLAAGAKH